MATTITGQMIVKTIDGRFGPFNVGTLVTELGEFRAKSKLLEEYKEGKYEGNFVIERIYSGSYTNGSTIVIETKADVIDIEIATADDSLKVPEENLIQDPIEEEISDETNNEKNTAVEHTSTKPKQDNADHEDLDPARLFGPELWPLQNTVKLDPTVSRMILRQQSRYLEDNGYTFNSKKQTWFKQ